jgi:hypothetical protein
VVFRDNRMTNCLRGLSMQNTVSVAPLVDGNYAPGVTYLVVGPSHYYTGGQPGEIVHAVVAGTPEAVVAAKVGSTAVNTSTGAVYRKTSGTGNTGWVTP